MPTSKHITPLLAIAGLLLACDTTETVTERNGDLAGAPDPEVVYLDQGWDAQTRELFYQTTQGSRMLPYSWFLHLEVANSPQPFRSPGHMRSMGYLVDDTETASNPDRLPIGFAKDEDPVRGDAIGLTCAACHTGEIEYGGTAIRIDGGQSLSDLEQLQNGLLASLEATLAGEAKFDRFARGVLEGDDTEAARAELRTEMESYRDWWADRIARSAGLSAHGPSRTDAFTIIGNEVVCQLLGVPENCTPAIAPTQYPHLWNTPDFDWVQYNSSVHSPLGRNVGEVTGVFAEASLDVDGSVISSANIPNLFQLELWLTSLQSPGWPEDVLGAIDQELAAEGEAIYEATCAGCHTLDPQPRTDPNAYGQTFAKVNFETPLAELGTDPTAAYAFATRRADPGPWTPLAQALGLLGPDGKASVAALLGVSGASIIQRFFIANALTPLEQITYLSFRESLSPSIAQLTTYKARPLNGIAFTAPYLHNGSVASIYELLLPPSDRKTQFYVGSKQYDPVELGYSTEQEANTVLFDTTELGNGNGGHYDGTDLDEAERMAVIEYIKTL